MDIYGSLVDKYFIKRFKQLKQEMLQLTPRKADTISINQVYVVKYNNTWYRVCIENQDDKTNKALCFFLDYGYTVPMKITDLHVCEPRFLCVEAQALRFSLIGLETLQNDKHATAKLKSLINQHVIVQVHTQQANYVSFNLIPTPIMVSLYDSKINDRFLEKFTCFPTVDINKFGTTAVTITHITKDGCLYVRPNDVKWQHLDETIHGLSSTPENLSNYCVQRTDLIFGKIYLILDNVHTLASNDDDKDPSVPLIKWFRGTLANLKCSIEYDEVFAMEDIDTGAIRLVRFGDIYILEEVRPDFIGIPRLSVKVAVHHIKDVSNDLVQLLNQHLCRNEQIMVEVASADKVPAVFVYKPLENGIENLYTINYQIISEYERNILEIPNNCLDAANHLAFKEEISKSFESAKKIDTVASEKLATENVADGSVDENENKVNVEEEIKEVNKVAAIAVVGNTDANNLPANPTKENLSAKNAVEKTEIPCKLGDTLLINEGVLNRALNAQPHTPKKEKEPKPILGRGGRYDVLKSADNEIENEKLQNQTIIEKEQNSAANVDLNKSNYIFSKEGVILAIQKPIPPPTAKEAAAYKEAALQIYHAETDSNIADDIKTEIPVIQNIALQEINIENSTKNSQFDNKDFKSHYLSVGKENQPTMQLTNAHGFVAKKIEAFQKLQHVNIDRKSTKETEENASDVQTPTLMITNQPTSMQHSSYQFNIQQQKLQQGKVADSKQNAEMMPEVDFNHFKPDYVAAAVEQNKPLLASQNRFNIDPKLVVAQDAQTVESKMHDINEPASDAQSFAASADIQSEPPLAFNENTNEFEIFQDLQQTLWNVTGDDVNTQKVFIEDAGGDFKTVKECSTNLKQDQSSSLQHKFKVEPKLLETFKKLQANVGDNTQLISAEDTKSVIKDNKSYSNDAGGDQPSFLNSSNKFSINIKQLDAFKKFQRTKTADNKVNEINIEGEFKDFKPSYNKIDAKTKQPFAETFKKFQYLHVNNNQQNEKDTKEKQIDNLTSQADKIQLKADEQLKDFQSYVVNDKEHFWRLSNTLKVNPMQLDAFKKSQNNNIADCELLATIPEMLVKQPAAEIVGSANENQQISWRSNIDTKQAEIIAKQTESTVKDFKNHHTIGTDGNGGQQSWRLNSIYNADTKENATNTEIVAQETNGGYKQYKSRSNDSDNAADRQTSWRSNSKYNVDLNQIETLRKTQVVKHNEVSETIPYESEFIKQFHADNDAQKFHAFKQILKDNLNTSSIAKETTKHIKQYKPDRAENQTQFSTKKYSPWSIECKEFKPNSKALDADIMKDINTTDQQDYNERYQNVNVVSNSKANTANKKHLRLDAPIFQYPKAKIDQKWSDNYSNGGKFETKQSNNTDNGKQFPKWLSAEKICELEFKPGKYKSLVELQNTEVTTYEDANASNNNKTQKEAADIKIESTVTMTESKVSQRQWYASEAEFKSKTLENDRGTPQSTATIESLKDNENIIKPAVNLQSEATKPNAAIVPGSLRAKLHTQKYMSLKDRLNKWKIKDVDKKTQEPDKIQPPPKDNQQISNDITAAEMEQLISNNNKVTETYESNSNNNAAAIQATNINDDKQKYDECKIKPANDSHTLKQQHNVNKNAATDALKFSTESNQDDPHNQYQKQYNSPLKSKDNYYDGVSDNCAIPKPKWPYDTIKKETSLNDSGVDLESSENSENDYLEYIQKFRLNNCQRYRNGGGLPPQLGTLQRIVELPKLKSYDQIPDINGYFEVNVTAVTSPTFFMIQPIRDNSLLMEMEKELNLYCKMNIELIPANHIEIGQAYAVQYSNGSFKRVIVKEILENGRIVSVNFCDCGVLCSVRSDELRTLPVKFRELPMMALQASLHYQAEWNAAHCNIFREICLSQRFYAVVKDVVVENEERSISVDLITLKNEHSYVHELMLLGDEKNSKNK